MYMYLSIYPPCAPEQSPARSDRRVQNYIISVSKNPYISKPPPPPPQSSQHAKEKGKKGASSPQNSHTRRIHEQPHAVLERLLRPPQRQRRQDVAVRDAHDVARLRDVLAPRPLGADARDLRLELGDEVVEAVGDLLRTP